jgi:hypothetical protein
MRRSDRQGRYRLAKGRQTVTQENVDNLLRIAEPS